MDEVILEGHGLIKTDGFVVCQTNDFSEDEYIEKLGLIFTDTDLISLFYLTNQGLIGSYGSIPQNEVSTSTPTVEYSPDDLMFWGFQGRVSTTGQLTALSTIAYDTACMQKFIDSIPADDFRWSEEIAYPLDDFVPPEETDTPDEEIPEPEEPETDPNEFQEDEDDGGVVVDTSEDDKE